MESHGILKSSKSTNPANSVLKLAAPVIYKQLTELFNISLKKWRIPR